MSDKTVEGSGLQHSRSRSCIKSVDVSITDCVTPEMQAKQSRDASWIRVINLPQYLDSRLFSLLSQIGICIA